VDVLADGERDHGHVDVGDVPLVAVAAAESGRGRVVGGH
jgi:hypothetical protein